jgi:hypothetical protein
LAHLGAPWPVLKKKETDMKKFLAITLLAVAPAFVGLNTHAQASNLDSKAVCIEGTFEVRGYHDTIARYAFRLRKKANGSVVFQSKIKNPNDPFASDQGQSRVRQQFSNDVLNLKRVAGGRGSYDVFRSQDERFEIKIENPTDDPRVNLNYFGFEVEGAHIRKCKPQ